MHALLANLTPIIAAEKSKTPFYIAGGLLVGWAFLLSMGLGMRNPSFPRNAAVQRGVMAITAVLVVAAVSMAIATSGGSTSAASATPPATSTTPAETPETPGTTQTAPAKEAQKAPSGASSLKEAANPEGQLKFTASQLSAKAGKVTISFANASPLEHNLTIAQGTKVLGATPTFMGGSKTLTLSLKPGTYKFFCTVPGHREAGMEGTLTVS